VKVSCVNSAPMAIARAADAVLTTIYEQWRLNLVAHLVIAGGRSGADLAAVIAAGLKKPRPKVLHLWFADERFVEYSDSYRNDTPIIKVLGSVGCTLIVHRYGTPSQDTFLAAAQRYAAELAAALGDEPFTTVVLSMGEDGHIASIFPNRDEFSGDVLTVDDAPKMPLLRISLSLNRLATTYECILLAIGESKLPAIQALLRKDPALPATLLARRTPIMLITDQPIGNYEDASLR
jgi:6-phosphogluconolactonase